MTFPIRPRIPLDNYLLNLVSKRDTKGQSLYLNGVEKFIQDFWREILKNNLGKVKVRTTIPRWLNFHWAAFYSYKNGKKAISITDLYNLILLWQYLCKKTDKEVGDIWNKLYFSDFFISAHSKLSKAQRTKLPKFLCPALSYLTGFFCGDGHFSNQGNHYLIRISEKSTKQISVVLKPLFKKIFSTEPNIYKIYQAGHAFQLCNKAIYRFFSYVLPIYVGEIPNWAFSLDEINKAYFLAGIFDAE